MEIIRKFNMDPTMEKQLMAYYAEQRLKAEAKRNKIKNKKK